MTTSYYRMHSRSAHRPLAWPLVYRVGIELASVNPLLEVVRTDEGEMDWTESRVREALEKTNAEFAEDRRARPYLMMFPFIFIMRNAVRLDFTLAWDEAATRLKAVTLVFQEQHVAGPNRLSLNEIARVFEKIIEQTGSSCGEFGEPPPMSEEWYYEAGRKTDVERVPTSVEWMTYFGPELVERIGARKFRQVPEGEIRDVGGGILLTLQREPFSYEDPEHRARQMRVNKYLDLARIHKLYPRRTELRASTRPPGVKHEGVRVPVEETRQRAEVIVTAAQRLSGERLDYSPRSLARVDEIIERFRREGNALADISQTLIGFGCYVGEVIVKNAGGVWQASDETTLQWAQHSPVVRLEDGLVVNPLGKAIKRFQNGEEDSLVYFYNALVEGRAKRPNERGR